MSSEKERQQEKDAILDRHLFFQCFTGKRIVKYLTEKLRESNKHSDSFICVAIGGTSELLRTTSDNYTIRLLAQPQAPQEVRDKQLTMICKDTVSAFFNVEELGTSPEDGFTHFVKYKPVLDEHFDKMLAREIDIVVDYDGNNMLMPKVWFASSKKIDI